MNSWDKIEQLVLASKDFILTEAERKLIVEEEQQAYVKNLPVIRDVLDRANEKLKHFGFWNEYQINEGGLRFRFSLQGYYGPGGFSSQYHISGPLVLGIINPAGDEFASYYPNDIDQCVFIGMDFDQNDFEQFVLKEIEHYLQPENLITNKEQYERFRALLKD
ncbi:hypothetical protein ACTFQD_02675 [Aliivibrio fischeri]